MGAVRIVIVALLAAWAAVTLPVAGFIYLWIRERYGRAGPFPAAQARSLVNPLRALLQPVAPSVRGFRLRTGGVALEIGPGPGYFTPEASRAVGPDGSVVCMDVQPGMIEVLRDRLEGQRLHNVHMLAGDAMSLPFADRRFDNVFLVTVLGEIPDRPRALAELRRVMKPGAVLAIMESMSDCDYQLEGAVSDLCRATGFTVAGVDHHRVGYLMRVTAPG